MGDATGMQVIEVTQIKPSATNPRKHFDGPAMTELVDSVKRHGVLQPVLVRRADGAVEGGDMKKRPRLSHRIPEKVVKKRCGCTDAQGCPEGCSWVNKEHTLCSQCAS